MSVKVTIEEIEGLAQRVGALGDSHKRAAADHIFGRDFKKLSIDELGEVRKLIVTERARTRARRDRFDDRITIAECRNRERELDRVEDRINDALRSMSDPLPEFERASSPLNSYGDRAFVTGTSIRFERADGMALLPGDIEKRARDETAVRYACDPKSWNLGPRRLGR